MLHFPGQSCYTLQKHYCKDNVPPNSILNQNILHRLPTLEKMFCLQNSFVTSGYHFVAYGL